MKTVPVMILTAVLLGLGLFGFGVWAADHTDAPAVTAEPAADINDIFTWMSADGANLNLVMTVFPSASATTQFSDAVQYVFHINSSPAFGTAQTEQLLVCTFAVSQVVTCWLDDEELISGDASDPNGISDSAGTVRVFTGLRNDPFFFNAAGFNATVDAVVGAAGSLMFDEAGCPALDAATSNALVTQLQTAVGGGAAADFFSGMNVLTLSIEIQKSLVTPGGPILGIWGSTHRATS
jgi:hypothetical protein